MKLSVVCVNVMGVACGDLDVRQQVGPRYPATCLPAQDGLFTMDAMVCRGRLATRGCLEIRSAVAVRECAAGLLQFPGRAWSQKMCYFRAFSFGDAAPH